MIHIIEADDARALELYRSGAQDPQIASEFYTTPHTVREWRKRAGLQANQKPRTIPYPSTTREYRREYQRRRAIRRQEEYAG